MIKHRLVAWGMALVMSGGLVTVGARQAAASPEGRRNTAIGLGVATVGAALMKKKAAAVVLGVGTGVAAYKYHESLQDRKKKRAASRTAQVASYRERVSSRRPTTVARRPATRRPVAAATHVVRHRPSTSSARIAYAPTPVAPVAEQPVAAQPAAAAVVPTSAPAAPVAPAAPAGQPFGGPLALGLAALVGALAAGLWRWTRREKALAS